MKPMAGSKHSKRPSRNCTERRGTYRVEVSVSSGSGKLRTAGGVSGVTKESIGRAFSYMLAKKEELSIARELDVSDLHVEVIDLMNNRVEGEIGLGFLFAT
jgi:ATP-dependent Lon protease